MRIHIPPDFTDHTFIHIETLTEHAYGRPVHVDCRLNETFKMVGDLHVMTLKRSRFNKALLALRADQSLLSH